MGKRRSNNSKNTNSQINGQRAVRVNTNKVSAQQSKKDDLSEVLRVPERFTVLNKLVTRDLNRRTRSPLFKRFSKDDITRFLQDPYHHEDQLRQAVIYIYGASSHFRRLIQYFVGLSDLSYVVSPYKIDPLTANKKTINRNYRKVLRDLSNMSIKTQFPKILTVCLREDTFFGTMWVSSDNITIQQLPSRYCAISSIEGNVLNVTFDFTYFHSYPEYLDLYPEEFRMKYELYKADPSSMRWQELASPTSFAIKCNNEILDYSIPPFVGILREIYDIEDYKQLKLTKTELENYAILVMSLGITDNGEWQMDLGKAKQFWRNLDHVLPEEIGSVLSPMPISKISFERSNTGDTDTIAEAEQNLFSAAGVSSLIFNSNITSSNALLLSIKSDQMITYGIVKSIEDAINRFVQSQSYGKYFKVTFLDVSPYNRDAMGDMYLKACQYGLPMVSYYCASQGLNQAEMDSMNFLEDDVLGIKGKFIPLQSSATQSSTDSNGATDEGGAPTKGIGEVSDKREQNSERD